MSLINHERATIRGLLAEAEAEQNALVCSIESLCDTLRRGLNTAINPVARLEYAGLDAVWQDFIGKMAHHSGLVLKINRFKRELGE